MKTVRSRKEIKPLLPQIRKLLERVYGNRLVDVFLYGSFAKGRANKESDIDIAVILKGKVNKGKEIDKICEVLYDLELDTGELISVYPLSENELENSIWPLYQHIKKEGIKI
ncbi:MAG: nucleotidyltransferase domain-containing protein [candidate division Zixibacteria bacterium]|nr:nucleotidyltransferase domain-containing protein [candidate division Zixibacteria bacterium]